MMFTSSSSAAILRLMRLTMMMAIRTMNMRAQANWWKVRATESTGEASRKISRKVSPDQYAITVVMATKERAVLRFGWFSTRMKGKKNRRNGAITVLGRDRVMGWKESSLAIANSSATFVNSDGCRLKPPGRAIQRSTELALR